LYKLSQPAHVWCTVGRKNSFSVLFYYLLKWLSQTSANHVDNFLKVFLFIRLQVCVWSICFHCTCTHRFFYRN
jgi:hypothetical protein